MNCKLLNRRSRWIQFAFGVALVLAAALFASLGNAAWEYTTWRNKMIEWDYGTVDRLCGGDTEEDRLLEIRFVRQWEYKALKSTRDGKEVWFHWKLSKRHCGNWMLVDPSQQAQIRPFEVRFPNGSPRRDAVSCLGIPIDENEKHQLRDEASETLQRTLSAR